MNKKICIAFLGNAFHDSRITNLCDSLKADGFDVSVISFDWRTIKEDYYHKDIKIFKLDRSSSIRFYLNFGYRLYRELIKTDASVIFAEDIYTLPIVTLIAKINNIKVVYNSRELYAFIGGLSKRPFIQYIVKSIESTFINLVDLILTTGEMDSDFLEKFYGLPKTLVLRNIPLYQKPQFTINLNEMYDIPTTYKILLYQGVLIGGRGISNVIKAISQIQNVYLLLLGDGESKSKFEEIARENKVEDRVIFAGAISQKDLINYTASADIGIALIQNISVSYYHALPNKLFEYIMAGLPVLSCPLPQMKKIVEEYNVGIIADPDNEVEVIDGIKKLIESDEVIRIYKANCNKAALELNWQKEFERAKHVLYKVIS
ncbi:MAG: glycosyltransferase [Melioribacteraceae bacterium]|nr:glycosyltransferase [Melioribacteraceae bacterium]